MKMQTPTNSSPCGIEELSIVLETVTSVDLNQLDPTVAATTVDMKLLTDECQRLTNTNHQLLIDKGCAIKNVQRNQTLLQALNNCKAAKNDYHHRMDLANYVLQETQMKQEKAMIRITELEEENARLRDLKTEDFTARIQELEAANAQLLNENLTQASVAAQRIVMVQQHYTAQMAAVQHQLNEIHAVAGQQIKKLSEANKRLHNKCEMKHGTKCQTEHNELSAKVTQCENELAQCQETQNELLKKLTQREEKLVTERAAHQTSNTEIGELKVELQKLRDTLQVYKGRNWELSTQGNDTAQFCTDGPRCITVAGDEQPNNILVDEHKRVKQDGSVVEHECSVSIGVGGNVIDLAEMPTYLELGAFNEIPNSDANGAPTEHVELNDLQMAGLIQPINMALLEFLSDLNDNGIQ